MLERGLKFIIEKNTYEEAIKWLKRRMTPERSRRRLLKRTTNESKNMAKTE